MNIVKFPDSDSFFQHEMWSVNFKWHKKWQFADAVISKISNLGIASKFIRKFTNFNECSKNFMGQCRSALEFQVVRVCTPATSTQKESCKLKAAQK